MTATAHAFINHVASDETSRACDGHAGMSALVEACQTSCVLVQMQIYSPSRARTNRLAADAAREATGTTEGRYLTETMLVSLSRAIGALVKRARRYLEANSCPFGDYRQVLTSEYPTLRAKLREFEGEYRDLVMAATSDWDGYCELVERQVKGLWDESMLPNSQKEYLALCRIEVQILPIPNVTSLISLPSGLTNELQEEMRASVHRQYQDARDAQFNEVVAALRVAAERVTGEKRTTAATFRAAREAAMRILRFNVADDRQLEAVATAVQVLINRIDPSYCNTSEPYKVGVARDLNELVIHLVNRTMPSDINA